MPDAGQEQLSLPETHGKNLVFLYLPSILVGKNKSALEAAKDALKLNPNDP